MSNVFGFPRRGDTAYKDEGIFDEETKPKNVKQQAVEHVDSVSGDHLRKNSPKQYREKVEDTVEQFNQQYKDAEPWRT